MAQRAAQAGGCLCNVGFSEVCRGVYQRVDDPGSIAKLVEQLQSGGKADRIWYAITQGGVGQPTQAARFALPVATVAADRVALGVALHGAGVIAGDEVEVA